MLNTTFPWLAVLFIGFYPAVNEEFMSRVFSIPLVAKLTRSRVASVVIPALIWGFAHANYPAQPFYIRGVEVSIAGLFVGIILYRFGVVPCLVWHYVVDSGYTSMLMVRSGNLYLVVTALVGVGALLFPLAATLVGAWRRGGFVDDPGVLNAADPTPPEPPPRFRRRRRRSRRRRCAWRCRSVSSWPPLARCWCGAHRIPGRNVGVTMRPAAVRNAAESFLRDRGVDPSKWRLLVTANDDVLGRAARRYLLENGGLDQVAKFAAEVPAWRVRVFRPEDREGWQLAVDDGAGKVVRFEHSLREENAGAALTVEQARPKAEAALAAAGFDIGKLTFKEAKAEKRPARMDHTFTWKDTGRSVGEAEYLLDVTVQGDAVDGVSRRLKLPEAWERARDKATALYYARLAAMFAFIALLVTHGLVVFYRGVRGGAVAWRPVLGASALLLALFAAAIAVNSPLMWEKYDPSMPEALFRISTLIGIAIVTLFVGVLAVLVTGALTACFPGARSAADPAARRLVAGPTAAAAVAAVGAALAFKGAVGLARGALPRAFSDAPVGIPEAAATAIPGVGTLQGGVMLVLMALALIGVAVHLWVGLGKAWLKALVAAGLLLTVLPVGSGATALEVAAGFVQAVALVAGVALLARFALGANPAAYVLGAAWLGVLVAASPLIAQPGAFYALQGWAVVAVAVAASAWWLLRRPRRGFEGTPG